MRQHRVRGLHKPVSFASLVSVGLSALVFVSASWMMMHTESLTRTEIYMSASVR